MVEETEITDLFFKYLHKNTFSTRIIYYVKKIAHVCTDEVDNSKI